MKKTALAATLAALLGGLAGGYALGAKYPGDEPYTPTKLEWAVLHMQAHAHTEKWPSVSCSASETKRAVHCLVAYDSKTSSALDLDATEISIRKTFELFQKSHGWSWLTLEIEKYAL